MKVCRNINKIRKQVITKIKINKTYKSSTFVLVIPHISTPVLCAILSEDLVLCRLQSYSSTNEVSILMYTKKVKSRYVIGLPTTCSYRNCGKNMFLILELCLLNLNLHYQSYKMNCIIFFLGNLIILPVYLY